MENPITFNLVQNINPFVGVEFPYSKSYYHGLTGLQVYNLMVLDVKVKSTNNVRSVDGIHFRLDGRVNETQPTNFTEINGIMNGEVFDRYTTLDHVNNFRIYYDISSITEGFLWIHSPKYNAGLKIEDIVDVTVSLQNSNNILPLPINPSHDLMSYNTGLKGMNYGKSFDVRSVKTLNFKMESAGTGTGYYEVFLSASNKFEEKKGLLLRKNQEDFPELEGKLFSSTLNGYMYRVYANEAINVVVDVEDYDNATVSIVGKGTALNDIPYKFIFLKNEKDITKIGRVVYQSPSFNLETTREISDCLWNTFVSTATNKKSISISTDGVNGKYKTIALTADNFPNLKANSTVLYAWVLNRHGANNQTGIYARVCIVTNKGQVYHNYPERPTGLVSGDEHRFDESVIWDLPIGHTTRRHPSKDIAENREGYRYDPTLLDYSYEMKPAINQDNGFGHGGFGATTGTGDMLRPRFYQFQEADDLPDTDKDNGVDVPFRVLSYPCKTRKSTFVGTYQIKRARVCLFSTPDGGRNWFVEYEFASGGLSNMVGFGNGINTTSVGSYPSGAFSIQKREYIYPTAENKEPIDKFSYGTAINVTSISNEKEAKVTTATAHGLIDQDVIILKKNDTAATPFDFMTNTASAKDGGTGVVYQVKKINATQFYLKEYIYNPDSNLTTRHIHYVNELKDFISFGTGEIYPNGWIMLLEQKYKDSFAIVNPTNTFSQAHRLNSSKAAPQRLCSFWMADDDGVNPTVYLGSDEVNVPRPLLQIDGRTDLPTRSSAGIFKGKLSDMDDMTKFHSVLDVGDANIYAINFNGIIVAGFQMGHCAVSLDGGDSWEMLNVGSMLVPAGVDKSNTIYFNNGTCLKLR